MDNSSRVYWGDRLSETLISHLHAYRVHLGILVGACMGVLTWDTYSHIRVIV